MNEMSKAPAISSIFYISTNTTISPGGERRLIVSVRVFFLCIQRQEKEEEEKNGEDEEILCLFDKHPHHLVTSLSKRKKELAC